MSASSSELRTLLRRLDAYVSDVSGAPRQTPTASEAMATYTIAARLVEADLARPHTDLSMHRDVLTATQRMLHAALAAHGERADDAPARPALRLVEG